MDQQSIELMEAQRPVYERLINGVGVRGMLVTNVRDIGVVHFGLEFADKPAYNNGDIDEIVRIYKETFAKYDLWKAENQK